MKKLLVCLALGISLASVSTAFGQGATEEQRAKMQAMVKQQLKDSLQLSDAMADSVMAVRKQFMPQVGDIMRDQSLSAEQKQAKFNDIRGQIKERYKQVGLTDDEIEKIEAMDQRMRDRMRSRGNN